MLYWPHTPLPPSIHTLTLSSTKGFCVLVHLIPRLIYHAENKFLEKIGELHPRLKENNHLDPEYPAGSQLCWNGDWNSITGYPDSALFQPLSGHQPKHRKTKSLHFPIIGIPNFPGWSSHAKQEKFRPHFPTAMRIMCSSGRGMLFLCGTLGCCKRVHG